MDIQKRKIKYRVIYILHLLTWHLRPGMIAILEKNDQKNNNPKTNKQNKTKQTKNKTKQAGASISLKSIQGGGYDGDRP